MSLPDPLGPIRSAVESVLTVLHDLLATAGLDPAAVIGVGLLVVSAGAQVLTQPLASVGAAPAPGGRLLLLLPLVTAATGLAFPIGVTAYWACSALWTLGQQLVLPRVVRVA